MFGEGTWVICVATSVARDSMLVVSVASLVALERSRRRVSGWRQKLVALVVVVTLERSHLYFDEQRYIFCNSQLFSSWLLAT